jgi:hypothetical protein
LTPRDNKARVTYSHTHFFCVPLSLVRCFAAVPELPWTARTESYPQCGATCCKHALYLNSCGSVLALRLSTPSRSWRFRSRFTRRRSRDAAVPELPWTAHRYTHGSLSCRCVCTSTPTDDPTVTQTALRSRRDVLGASTYTRVALDK